MKNLSIVVLVLAVTVLACKWPGSVKESPSGGTAGESSSPSKDSSTGGSDPKADVVQASRKFLALPYFTANMEGVGQTDIKSKVAYAAPDRFHVKYTGGTGQGMEMISIGNDMYMNANGKWSKMPSSGTSMPNLRDSFTEEGLKSLTEVKFEGEDTLDGQSALTYSYKNVTPVGNYPFTSKIWVGKEDGVPKKLYVEYSNGTLKNMTIRYDTETPVTIEPPIK
ncbi:MAG TPA: hypothetical protein VJV05_13865 [Pyrinomonadaceae bacterium]|nr:hypothetical protein [Pyrinomonadaceae bacterium]